MGMGGRRKTATLYCTAQTTRMIALLRLVDDARGMAWLASARALGKSQSANPVLLACYPWLNRNVFFFSFS